MKAPPAPAEPPALDLSWVKAMNWKQTNVMTRSQWVEFVEKQRERDAHGTTK